MQELLLRLGRADSLIASQLASGLEYRTHMTVETRGNVGPQSQSEPSGFVGFNKPTRMVPTLQQ
eukprot:12403482-Karenia_brevis.AAC.1